MTYNLYHLYKNKLAKLEVSNIIKSTYKKLLSFVGLNFLRKEITNDKQHCKQIARENSNLVSNFSFWFMSPQAETKYRSLYRKCLINRGHSVLN